MRKILATGAVLALVGAGAITAIGLAGRSHQVVAAPPSPIATAAAPTPSPTVIQQTAELTYTGDVQPRAQIAVIPKVTGRIVKLNVDVGSQVKAGDVIAEIETDQLKLQVDQAQAAYDAAKARLDQISNGPRPEQVAQAQANADAARARLAAMQEGPRPEQVAQAEANLRAAEARLAQVKQGATPEQIAAAEAQVRLAKNQLYLAQAQGDALLGSRLPNTYTKDQKEAQAGIAYEQIQIAEANLAGLKKGARPEEIAQAQAAVDAAREQLALAQHPYTKHDIAQAEAALRAAEQQLQLAKAPYTETDRRAAQAAVEQAEAALNLAKLQLAEATVRAPIDGIIAQKLQTVGALAGPTSPIVSLVSTEVDVVVHVEESQLGRIHVGQAVTITTAAYPDQPIAGTVSLISPTIDPTTRTFTVRIEPRPGQRSLMPGMFAEVSFMAESSH